MELTPEKRAAAIIDSALLSSYEVVVTRYLNSPDYYQIKKFVDEINEKTKLRVQSVIDNGNVDAETLGWLKARLAN